MGDKFGGQQVTVHPAKFTLQNGFLKYDNMQVDVGEKPFYFKGVIGLDKSLDMTVTVPVSDGVSVPIRGTVDNPKPDVARLTESLIKKQLEKELKKSLEGLFKK
jgi:hypothetical protein